MAMARSGVVARSIQGEFPTAIAVADLNHDGKLDLVVGTQLCKTIKANCLAVLLAKGDGTFMHPVLNQLAVKVTPAAERQLRRSSSPISWRRQPDLVTLMQAGARNGDGLISVLIGNGNGTFQSAATYDSGVSSAIPLRWRT